MAKKELDPFYYVDGMAKAKDGHSIPFARLPDPQARSRTYQRLSDKAKVVYMTCKLCRQYHAKIDGLIQGDIKNFYFNRPLQKQYGLNDPNKTRAALVELVCKGFIEVVWNGATTRTKTIYKFSDQWKKLDKGQDIELSETSRTFIQGSAKIK